LIVVVTTGSETLAPDESAPERSSASIAASSRSLRRAMSSASRDIWGIFFVRLD